MPTIARRTPQTEETAAYGYRDLLKDIMRKISTEATSNVERMTSGKLGSEELLEMAMAPAGGMLKIAGTSKLLAGLLARQKLLGSQATRGEASRVFAPTRNVFKEALKVPEKEYGRIKDIGWESMAGQSLGTKGLYDPWSKKISLHPTFADAETVWHEFVHARQCNPERMSRLPGGESEKTAAQELRRLLEELTEIARAGKISRSDFYTKVSPIERHARGVAEVVRKYPKDFESIYKAGLTSELKYSTEKLLGLTRALERQRELGMGYRLTGD